MLTFRYEVRREIPCAPFWAPVTAPEIRHVGLDTIHGRTFTAETSSDAETVLEDTGMEIPKSAGTLDRTYLTVVNVATMREVNVRIDLSSMGRE